MAETNAIRIRYHEPDWEVVFLRICKHLGAANGNLRGNSERGEISLETPLGPVNGHYVAQGGRLTITVVSKPAVVSMNRVEKEILANLLG